MEKLEFEVWNGSDYENKEFEIQGMDPFIYKKIDGEFTRSLDLEILAKKMLSEMVITPAEARNIDFWKKDPEGLDAFVKELSEYQEGLYKPKRKRSKARWKKEES